MFNQEAQVDEGGFKSIVDTYDQQGSLPIQVDSKRTFLKNVSQLKFEVPATLLGAQTVPCMQRSLWTYSLPSC